MKQRRFGCRFAPGRHGRTVAWGAVFTMIVTFLHPSPSWGFIREANGPLMEQIAMLQAQVDLQQQLIVALQIESQTQRGLPDLRASDILSLEARLEHANARLARMVLRVPPLGGNPEIVAADLTGRLSEIQAVASLAPDELFVNPTVALQAVENEIQPALMAAAGQLQLLDPATLNIPEEFSGSLLAAVDELNTFVIGTLIALEHATTRVQALILRLHADEQSGTTATVDYLADSAARFLRDALEQIETLEALEAKLAIVESSLDGGLGAGSQAAYVPFQAICQRRQQTLQILFKVAKVLHEMAMTGTRNIL